MRRDTPRLPHMQLSLDLSTKSSGWAIMDGNKLVDYGCITANDNDKVERIHKMVAGLQWVVGMYFLYLESLDKGIMNTSLHYG